MQRLLTIAIPTYLRADLLDRQMRFIVDAIKGYEQHVELIISDNCSKDHTPSICRKWQEILGSRLYCNRNARNIGALANIAYCINAARGQFIWVVGDDDRVDADTPRKVLDILLKEQGFVSILMNFASVGKTVFEKCYPFEGDGLIDGPELVHRCLRANYFGLAFMTAHVYRTTLAQQAIQSWLNGTWNYDYQIFVTAFCARYGKVRIVAEPMMQYVTGYNVYETDPRANLRVAGDTSEVMVRLVRIGYSRRICSSIARRHLRRFGPKFWQRAIKKPQVVPGILTRYALALIQLHIMPVLSQAHEMDLTSIMSAASSAM